MTKGNILEEKKRKKKRWRGSPRVRGDEVDLLGFLEDKFLELTRTDRQTVQNSASFISCKISITFID